MITAYLTAAYSLEDNDHAESGMFGTKDLIQGFYKGFVVINRPKTRSRLCSTHQSSLRVTLYASEVLQLAFRGIYSFIIKGC